MKKLLQEIGDLIQEKEDSQKGLEENGNWCHPSIPPMTQLEFDKRMKELVSGYVRRLALCACESA
tara:strand:- start:33 stop:227 length:195 start_codon:yes stop_codon:yes gene_type:complete